jgi:hypothetical protein
VSRAGRAALGSAPRERDHLLQGGFQQRAQAGARGLWEQRGVLKIKQLLEVGQVQQAVEYLGGIGWQDPEGQVEAVRATLAEWDKPYEGRKEQRRKRQYLSG